MVSGRARKQSGEIEARARTGAGGQARLEAAREVHGAWSRHLPASGASPRTDDGLPAPARVEGAFGVRADRRRSVFGMKRVSVKKTLSTRHVADSHDLIRVQGARENNLKDVSVEIPKRRLTVFTGVSGSGKSSLVFGT